MTSEVLRKSNLFNKNQNGHSSDSDLLYTSLVTPTPYTNGTTRSELFENGNDCSSESSSKKFQNSVATKSDESIYSKPKSNSSLFSSDSLIPQAAKLILAQTPKNRSDLVDLDRSEGEVWETFIEDEDFVDEPRTPSPDYELGVSGDFRDSFEFGLEVIHEETESQISSDEDQELDCVTGFCVETIRQRKRQPPEKSITTNGNGNMEDISTLENSEDPKSITDDIIVKHIRIPSNWDPAPLLQRLHHIVEPPPQNNNGHAKGIQGYVQLLSGNRKKATFFNAWKRLYCCVNKGKLMFYSKDDCKDLFQQTNLIGGQVDFLDPTEFVGAEKGKNFVNKIFGVDDGKGHYFVLQCASASEAQEWVEAMKHEVLTSVSYSVPILPKSPSTFRDILLIDLGSTHVRAGVVTFQATLPSLFFEAVTSQDENGRVLFGNEVYLPQNRKKAKIRYPFESTSKLCLNTIDTEALEGFIFKILKDMNVQAVNYRLILILPRRTDNKSKTNILQLLFGKFQFRSALLLHQTVASFWSYPVENGLICDIGERCDVVPVSQGFVISNAWFRAPFGGHVLKHCLRQGLGPQENGLYLSTATENLLLRYISENFICVNSTEGGRKLSQDSQEIVVEMDLRDILPFSNLIGINQEVLRSVAEGFFDPGQYGLDCDSLPKLVKASLDDCGVDIRKEMSQNILLVGGCTLIPGLAERLQSELIKLCPPHLKPKLQISPYRYHASFIGASVLAATDAYEQSLLSKADYKDGPGPTHWLI